MSRIGDFRVRAVVVTLAASLLFVAPCAARTLSGLSIPAQVDANAPFGVTYHAGKAPPHSSVVLQRQVGTAHHWKTIARLGVNKTVQVPAIPMGAEVYRAQLLTGGKVLATSSSRKVEAFAQVPLGDVLSTKGADRFLESSGSTNVGTHTFNFVAHSFFNGGRQMHSDGSACRSAHFELASPAAGSNDWMWSVSVLQQSADAVTASVGPAQITSLDVTLAVGQSWSLTDSWLSGPSGTGGTSLYINGTLSCYARATIEDDT